jgi:hypothetical protein
MLEHVAGAEWGYSGFTHALPAAPRRSYASCVDRMAITIHDGAAVDALLHDVAGQPH